MAQFKQERHVQLVSGANQAFVITNQMVSASIPSELPSLGVFVLNIVDDADPKADTLARVATLADLTTIPIGREAGIAAPGPNGKQFLSPTWTASYDQLQTALDAAEAFRARVNQLILDWQTFRTNFNAPDPAPAIYTLPGIISSQKSVLIAAYKTAKQDRYQKQIVKADADDTLARAQADYTYKQDLVSDLDPINTAAATNVTEFTTTAGNFSTLKTAGDTFLGANPGGVGASTFQTALNTAAVQASQHTAYLGDASALATSINTYRTARQTDASTASATLSTAITDQATAAQDLIEVQALEASTLAAVLAVCPDFDKRSIPFVDDTEP